MNTGPNHQSPLDEMSNNVQAENSQMQSDIQAENSQMQNDEESILYRSMTIAENQSHY